MSVFDGIDQFYHNIPSWRVKIVKDYKRDWSKYTFERAFKHLLESGLSGKPPTMNSTWMKLLVNFQIFGGCGTFEDMLSYAGMDQEGWKRLKYKMINFLEYYSIIEEIKRTKDGRIYELTPFGTDLIVYVAQH
jgi:hypothetical protein